MLAWRFGAGERVSAGSDVQGGGGAEVAEVQLLQYAAGDTTGGAVGSTMFLQAIAVLGDCLWRR